ncbi:MAG: efflux RND transporter periplasmic adaptor subunit [Terracidiphilus sp.]|jgi:RND family efflux transporter MFP subunit
MNQEPNAHSQSAAASHETAPEASPLSPRKALVGVAVVLLILIVLAAVGILRRLHADTVLAQRTDALAAPTVDIAPAKAGAPIETLVLPGNVTAYTDSPIYARTDGYLEHWYADIGAQVKKGTLLAAISTPELDKQVAQAESDLATAEATANNARIEADRYSGLVKSNAVSQQDTDTFVNQAVATASAVKSAQANLQRLVELQSFEKIYAPFDGVVTAREIDTGQLINSGSGQGGGTELFHMQALQTLRVYTNVPQLFSQTMKRGMKVDLTFPEYAGKTFQGTLVRTADAIDPVSRTLLVEVDVDNRGGQLMPGSLAQVHFKAASAAATYIVPESALIFRREGLQVATVIQGSAGTVAHLLPVVIGEDDGATVQIISGLSPNDKIVQDPPDSLIDGEKVTVESSQGSAFGAGGL